MNPEKPNSRGFNAIHPWLQQPLTPRPRSSPRNAIITINTASVAHLVEQAEFDGGGVEPARLAVHLHGDGALGPDHSRLALPDADPLSARQQLRECVGRQADDLDEAVVHSLLPELSRD